MLPRSAAISADSYEQIVTKGARQIDYELAAFAIDVGGLRRIFFWIVRRGAGRFFVLDGLGIIWGSG